ncbi:hypothetical protein KAR91_77650 [Candidatus Pacearchaeota archaeon]|nr:hypothetical protein [Candidatus Pacearchaeota archaeon]
MIRFTPPPWKMSSWERQTRKPHRRAHSRSSYNFAVVIWSLGGKTAEIFNRHGRVTREKMLANGRLMAVSPDMHNLLEDILEIKQKDLQEDLPNLLDKAKAILSYVDGTGNKP